MTPEGNETPEIRTAREITNPDRPDADALQYCQECGEWTGHRMTENGSYSCLPCEGASDEDVREAVAEVEEESRL